MPFVTLLGLFKDDTPLLHNLGYDVFVKRNFSSSYISPYTANILFVLYQCDQGMSAACR